jgi:hypothetical protein
VPSRPVTGIALPFTLHRILVGKKSEKKRPLEDQGTGGSAIYKYILN